MCQVRWRAQRTLRAFIVLLAALTALQAVWAPSSAQAAAPCTDVEIVGARGSGENPPKANEHEMGSLIGPVADAIAFRLGGALTVGFTGLDYPAGDADIVTVGLSRSYFRSKDQGVRNLRSYLNTRVSECPHVRFVLMGYSQGAHVIGDLLATVPDLSFDPVVTSQHIAAMVFFGDPRFNPNTSYAWGTFENAAHGMAGARSGADFSSWSSKVKSVCDRNDPVCQGVDKLIRFGAGAHSQSSYRARYEAYIGGWAAKKLGVHDPGKLPLDLAFVIDSTGSMGSGIYNVTTAASTMIQTLAAQRADFRVGLVDYKDTDQGDPYAAQLDLNLTGNANAFYDALGNLWASGGGDWPEAVYSGLMTAFKGMSWRVGSRKAVVLMGDAPAKNPEPVTGYTEMGVILAANRLALSGSARSARTVRADETPVPVGVDDATARIHSVSVYSGATDSFKPLSEGTGGLLLEGTSDVADNVLRAVEQASAPLYVTLSAPAAAQTGVPVPFEAFAEYDKGAIDSFQWDFDGDGAADQTTATGEVSHTFPAPYTGQVTVKAIAADGNSGTAASAISVVEQLPAPPDAPDGVAANALGSDGFTLSWRGVPGDTISGYSFLVTDASGEPMAAGITDQDARSADVSDLPAGRYLAEVRTLSDTGVSDPGKTEFTVKSPVTDLRPDTGDAGSSAQQQGNTPPAVTSQGSSVKPPAKKADGTPPPLRSTVRMLRWTARGLRMRAYCPADAMVDPCVVKIKLQVRRAGRMRTVRTLRTTVPSAGIKWLTVRVSAQQRRRIRRGAPARLLVTTKTHLGTAKHTVKAPRS